MAAGWKGREIPSLRLRYWRVDRFKPSRAAARRRPASTQPVSFSRERMCLRSASSRVPSTCLCSESSSMSYLSGLTLPFAIGAFNPDSGTRGTRPGDRLPPARSGSQVADVAGPVISGQSLRGFAVIAVDHGIRKGFAKGHLDVALPSMSNVVERSCKFLPGSVARRCNLIDGLAKTSWITSM